VADNLATIQPPLTVIPAHAGIHGDAIGFRDTAAAAMH